MRTSIIIPTFNEVDNINELIERIFKAMKQYDFQLIIVDDNSDDGTALLASQLSHMYMGIKVIVRPMKQGLASAIIWGVAHANGDIIIVLDSDLQHPPEVIPKLLDFIKQGYDIAIASRYIAGGKTEGWSDFRRLVSKVAILLCHILFPKTWEVRDVVSGFFAVKKEVLPGLTGFGYKVLTEILIKGKYQRVVEVPYDFRERKKGKSKLNLNVVMSYIMSLIKLATPGDEAKDAYHIRNRRCGKKD